MTPTQEALLTELEPVVEANLNRHLEKAKPWNPHDYVPWSRGRDFALLGGQDWTPEDSQLDEVSKAAMIVNLLTEDNLPSYHREIAVRFGSDGAWGQWVGQWTAEEGRHSIALRDYLIVTRGVDPVALERGRMVHMATTRVTSRCWRPWPMCPSRNWRRGSVTATPAARLDVPSPNSCSPG
jgi:acyl-[acyl-carrier-protein] desaturase